MAKKRRINVKLFKKIIAHAKADIRRLEMRFYGVKEKTDGAEEVGFDMTSKDWAACGTKACCAGWAVLLSTPKNKWSTLFTRQGAMKSTTHNKAAKLLGLSGGEACDLFTGDATFQDTGEAQLEVLRQEINQLFEENGLKDRV